MTLLPALAFADTADRLRVAASEMEAAAARVETQGADKISLARAVGAFDDALAELRVALRESAVEERSLVADFEARRESLGEILGILSSLQDGPAPVHMMHPEGPVGTARAAQMMVTVAPALQAQAADMRAALEELRALRTVQAETEAQLTASLASIQEARTQLGSKDGVQVPDMAPEIARLRESAASLDEFTGNLGAMGREETALPSRADLSAMGMALPAPGEITARYNEADGAGRQRPGLTLATAPQTLVSAPALANIRFAGSFLDYGNVVILEPAAGLLVILAGLDQVFVREGQIVAEETPLGLMGGLPLGSEAVLNDAQQAEGKDLETEPLYIEVRQDDATVDPEEWFTLIEDESSEDET
ncbi:murein hydrolase activator EnvC family protein [Paracoccaceae bacterium GXU_MW_L88]